MNNDNKKLLSSIALKLSIKNPYVLLAIVIIFLVLVVVVSSFMIFSGSSNEGINDGDKQLYYAKCTEGQLNHEQFNKMFENAGALTGQAQAFISASSQNSIDPVILASISFNETGKGKSAAVKNKNNPGGMMNPKTGSLFVFDSIEEGILAMASNLNRLYISKGLVTIIQIGNKYAPIGVANDPNNLNINWVPNVTNFANQFGGLTMNCTSANLGSGKFLPPVPNPRITSSYGYRIDPVTGASGEFHLGIDFACKKGDPIYSSSGGKIAVARQGGGSSYGNHVVINHGDKYTLYGHMTTLYVSKDQTVEQGQVLGTCGMTGNATGPHVHFEIQYSLYGQRVDPIDFLNGVKK